MDVVILLYCPLSIWLTKNTLIMLNRNTYFHGCDRIASLKKMGSSNSNRQQWSQCISDILFVLLKYFPSYKLSRISPPLQKHAPPSSAPLLLQSLLWLIEATVDWERKGNRSAQQRQECTWSTKATTKQALKCQARPLAHTLYMCWIYHSLCL